MIEVKKKSPPDGTQNVLFGPAISDEGILQDVVICLRCGYENSKRKLKEPCVHCGVFLSQRTIQKGKT